MLRIAHAEVWLLHSFRDRDRQLHGDAVFRDRRIGKFLRGFVAGNAPCAIVPLQQHRNRLVVVQCAHRDGVVGGREKTFLCDELRNQVKSGRRGFFPARIVRRAGQIAFHLVRLDDGVFRIDFPAGLGQRCHIVGYMPAFLDREFLLASGVGEGRHLGAGNARGKARKNILRVAAAEEGPRLGQVARPGALAGVSLEPLAGAALAGLAVAFHAAIPFFIKLPALRYALVRACNLLAEVDLRGRWFVVTGEGLDVSHQVPHVLFLQDIAPARHRGARHAVADHAIDVVIVGRHVFKAGRFDLVVAGGEIARRRIEQLFRRARPIAIRPVAPGAALVVNLLALGGIAGFRRRRARSE